MVRNVPGTCDRVQLKLLHLRPNPVLIPAVGCALSVRLAKKLVTHETKVHLEDTFESCDLTVVESFQVFSRHRGEA